MSLTVLSPLMLNDQAAFDPSLLITRAPQNSHWSRRDLNFSFLVTNCSISFAVGTSLS